MNFTSEPDNLVTMVTEDVLEPETSNPGWSLSDIENSAVIRVIYAIITMLGLVGNFLVCFALFRVPALRSKTSHFIIHLAITDIITLTWVIPLHLFPYVPRLSQQPGYDALCRLFFSKFPLWTTMFASAYGLLLVTTERCTAIVFPVKYEVLFTKRNSGFMMASCWLIGVIYNIYALVAFGLRDGNCNIVWPTDQVQIFVGLYHITLVYMFPVGFMLYAHFKMIVKLKQRVKQMRSTMRAGPPKAKKEKENEVWQLRASEHLVRTLLWVVVTYAVCWAPNQFIFFAYNMGASIDFSQPYYHFTVILAICNFCMNPFIYSLKNKPYRLGIKEALKWKVSTKTVASSISNRPGRVSKTDTPRVELSVLQAASVVTLEEPLPSCVGNDVSNI